MNGANVVEPDTLHINVGLSESGKTRTLKFVVTNESVDLFRLVTKLSPLVISAKIGMSHVEKSFVAIKLSDEGWTSTDLSEFITKVKNTISDGFGYKSDHVIVNYEKEVRKFITVKQYEERKAFSSRSANPDDIQPPHTPLRAL